MQHVSAQHSIQHMNGQDTEPHWRFEEEALKTQLHCTSIDLNINIDKINQILMDIVLDMDISKPILKMTDFFFLAYYINTNKKITHKNILRKFEKVLSID